MNTAENGHYLSIKVRAMVVANYLNIAHGKRYRLIMGRSGF